MRDAVIVDAVRTAVGKRNGALSQMHAVSLSAHVLEALADRVDLDPALVDDVIWGCVGTLGMQSGCIARSSVLAAGWPEHVPGVTVDRQCGSSQQAVHQAAAGVISGQYDVAIAGGVEMMSAVPMGSARADARFGEPHGPLVWERYNGIRFNQGVAPDDCRKVRHLASRTGSACAGFARARRRRRRRRSLQGSDHCCDGDRCRRPQQCLREGRGCAPRWHPRKTRIAQTCFFPRMVRLPLVIRRRSPTVPARCS